jgi:hypothetical protein
VIAVACRRRISTAFRFLRAEQFDEIDCIFLKIQPKIAERGSLIQRLRYHGVCPADSVSSHQDNSVQKT